MPHHHRHGFVYELWETLKAIPALRYVKAPVLTLSDLYERYPDGCEVGVTVFVTGEKKYYTWDFDNKIWVKVRCGCNCDDCDGNGNSGGDTPSGGGASYQIGMSVSDVHYDHNGNVI
jgi:hypothetical protein